MGIEFSQNFDSYTLASAIELLAIKTKRYLIKCKKFNPEVHAQYNITLGIVGKQGIFRIDNRPYGIEYYNPPAIFGLILLLFIAHA